MFDDFNNCVLTLIIAILTIIISSYFDNSPDSRNFNRSISEKLWNKAEARICSRDYGAHPILIYNMY